MAGFSRRDAARLAGLGAGSVLVGGIPAHAQVTEGGPAHASIPSNLDHVVWAVPDLDEGIRLITDLTGVAPVSGGTAPGKSLPHNALLSLGNGSYLEVFCPARAGGPNAWGPLVADGKPHVASYCLHVQDRFKALLPRIQAAGLTHTGPRAMGRVRPDGGTLHWELLNVAGSSSDGGLPFFIDWLDSQPHPSQSSPAGVEIEALIVADPEADALAQLYSKLGIETRVVRSDKHSINLYLKSPKGRVLLF